MWHWILEHSSAFNDIGLAWIVPILLVFVATRLFRPDYRRPNVELIPVRADAKRDKTSKPRSAA